MEANVCAVSASVRQLYVLIRTNRTSRIEQLKSGECIIRCGLVCTNGCAAPVYFDISIRFLASFRRSIFLMSITREPSIEIHQCLCIQNNPHDIDLIMM